MVVATVTFLKLGWVSEANVMVSQLRSQRWHIAPEAWERQVVPLGRLLVSMIDWLTCKQSSKLAETGWDTVSVVVDHLEAAANKWRCGWLSSWAYFHQWGHFALRAVRRLSQATYQGMKDIQWTFSHEYFVEICWEVHNITQPDSRQITNVLHVFHSGETILVWEPIATTSETQCRSSKQKLSAAWNWPPLTLLQLDLFGTSIT